MSHLHIPSLYAEASDQATHVGLCATELSDPAKSRNSTESIGFRASTSAKGSASTQPTSPTSSTRRSPENKKRTRRIQHETFSEHLRIWASNHDSSAHFHGSICLYPPSMYSSENMELGKSVSCILMSAHTGSPSKEIVIRLFRSQRYNSQENVRKARDNRCGQSIMPYQLVIRSGSGWVPARQYFDKYYFAYQTRHQFTQNTTQANVTQLSPMVANSTVNLLGSTQSVGLAGLMSTNGIINLPSNNSQASTWTTPISNNSSLLESNRKFNATISSHRRTLTFSVPAHPRSTEHLYSGTEPIKIGPLFRPFLSLPQELQDDILYQAVGYTRVIGLTQGMPASTSPITMSTLFRISKSINEHILPHIFLSTNFHFGITGFTKFLWQVGPCNRSKIRHLTFHFGKASLLHCIRWMAADPVWELFEPPVATDPPTLMYFWRCQLQDLMKELNLSTLTIDIRDVPLADVPMLIRIISTAIGSFKDVRIVDSYARPDKFVGDFNQDSYIRFPHMQHFTWRDMCLQYHNDYKYRRWHMKHILALREVDLCPVLETWMNENEDFFDS